MQNRQLGLMIVMILLGAVLGVVGYAQYAKQVTKPTVKSVYSLSSEGKPSYNDAKSQSDDATEGKVSEKEQNHSDQQRSSQKEPVQKDNLPESHQQEEPPLKYHQNESPRKQEAVGGPVPASPYADPPPVQRYPMGNPSIQLTDLDGSIVEDPTLKVKGLRLIVCGIAKQLKGELCRIVFWTDKGEVGDAAYMLPPHAAETFQAIVFIPQQTPPITIEQGQLRIYRESDHKLLLSTEIVNNKTDLDEY